MPSKLIIDEQIRNQRLDVLVTSKFPSLSRAYIQKLIGEGNVLVNDAVERPGYRLRLGDSLQLNINIDQLQQIPDIDLPVLYEDENIIVINKPTGVISHSRGKYWYEPSVASFIRQKAFPSKHGSHTPHGSDRAGIVHRLDRATSGVMICAKNNETLIYLQKQFSTRKVDKTYIALVNGHMKEHEAIIDMPIERNPKQPQSFRVGENGKPAQTRYKVLKSLRNHDKLRLIPLTGRTHQLRVHLKQVGHPIVGDTLYGTENAERLYLHAQSLEISLPDGTRSTFTAPEPPEFKLFEKNNG